MHRCHLKKERKKERSEDISNRKELETINKCECKCQYILHQSRAKQMKYFTK